MIADPITTVIVSVALWLSLKTDAVQKQMEAVTAIRNLGGSVYYDYQRVNPVAPNVFDPKAVPRGPEWLRRIVGDDYFRTVVRVSFRDTDIDDDDLRILLKVPRIENLDLTNTGISSAGMEHLRSLTNLRCLCLWKTQVDDDGVKHLQGMTEMWLLVLDETLVTDAGLEHLEGLTKLENWLGLSKLLISDQGLRHLNRMRKLQNLTIRDTGVTAAGMGELKRSLPKTDISFAPVNDDLTFERLALRKDVDAAVARMWLGTVLRQQIGTVHRICRLTAAQKRRLSVAGRGSIERFLDRITAQQNSNSEHQEWSISSGPFGKNSIFIKTVDRVLTADQAEKFAPFASLFQQGVQVQIWQDAGGEMAALRLTGSACTDQALGQLKGIDNLRVLVLKDAPVTEAGFGNLRQLSSLKELWLFGIRASDATISDLQQAVPGLKVRQ